MRAGSHWIAFCNEDCLLFSAEQAHSRYVSCQVRPFLNFSEPNLTREDRLALKGGSHPRRASLSTSQAE